MGCLSAAGCAGNRNIRRRKVSFCVGRHYVGIEHGNLVARLHRSCDPYLTFSRARLRLRHRVTARLAARHAQSSFTMVAVPEASEMVAPTGADSTRLNVSLGSLAV